MAKRPAAPPPAAPPVRIPDSLQALAIAISTLRPWPLNPRIGNIDAIRESLRVNGQFRPIVVRRSDNTILAGNHTYHAAIAESWDQIAATFVDADDEQAARIVLADNRTASLGTFDDDRLAELLKSLPEPTLGTGFDQGALDELLASLTTQPLPEPRDVTFQAFDESAADDLPTEPCAQCGRLCLKDKQALAATH